MSCVCCVSCDGAVRWAGVRILIAEQPPWGATLPPRHPVSPWGLIGEFLEIAGLVGMPQLPSGKTSSPLGGCLCGGKRCPSAACAAGAWAFPAPWRLQGSSGWGFNHGSIQPPPPWVVPPPEELNGLEQEQKLVAVGEVPVNGAREPEVGAVARPVAGTSPAAAQSIAGGLGSRDGVTQGCWGGVGRLVLLLVLWRQSWGAEGVSAALSLHRGGRRWLVPPLR